MKKNSTTVEKAIANENKYISDLKRPFMKKTLRAQQHTQYSPMHVSGNIALSFYRGKQVGFEEATKALKKKFPEAYKHLKG